MVKGRQLSLSGVAIVQLQEVDKYFAYSKP